MANRFTTAIFLIFGPLAALVGLVTSGPMELTFIPMVCGLAPRSMIARFSAIILLLRGISRIPHPNTSVWVHGTPMMCFILPFSK